MCRQILYYSLETETFVRCKEINYNDIKEGEVLGSGASGTVSRVNFDGIDVAVKQFRIFGLNKEDCDVFRTEILIASNLDHPNIIKWFVLSSCFPFPIPQCGLTLKFPRMTALAFVQTFPTCVWFLNTSL